MKLILLFLLLGSIGVFAEEFQTLFDDNKGKTDVLQCGQGRLNGIKSNLVKVRTVGHKVVIDNNHILTNYAGEGITNVKEVIIIADTIIVKTPLHFQMSNIKIKSNFLQFGSDAKIKTTPKKANPIKKISKNGIDGDKAGDLYLDVDSVDVIGSKRVVFDLQGGKGGKGGPGKHNRRKPIDIKFRYSGEHTDLLMPKGFKELEKRVNDTLNKYPVIDADSAGYCGIGGPGGSIYGNYQKKAELHNLDNGVNGDYYNNLYEGSSKVKVTGTMGGALPNGQTWKESKTRVSTVGKSYQIRKKDIERLPKNKNGSIHIMDISSVFCHDLSLYETAVLTQVNSRYLYLSLTASFDQASINEFISILNQILKNTKNAKLINEITIIRNKVVLGRDYYGNPFNWIPFHDLSEYRKRFVNQISLNADILAHTWIMQDYYNDLELDITAKKEQVVMVNKGIKRSYNELDALIGERPQVLALQDSVKFITQTVKSDFERIKNEITAKSNSTVKEKYKQSFLQRVTPLVKTVANCVPGYGTMISAGLDLVVDVESFSDKGEYSLNSISKLVSSYKSFEGVAKSDWKEKGDAFFDTFEISSDSLYGSGDFIKKTISKLAHDRKLSKETKKEIKAKTKYAKQKFKTYRNFAKEMSSARRAVDSLRNSQVIVPRNEVERTIQKMQAESPEYQRLFSKLQELVSIKARLDEKLMGIEERIVKLSSGIENGYAQISILADVQGKLSHVQSDYLKNYLYLQGKTARDRLVYDYYQLLRAYHYLSQDNTSEIPDLVISRMKKLVDYKQINIQGYMDRKEAYKDIIVNSYTSAYEELNKRITNNLDNYNAGDIIKFPQDTLDLILTNLIKNGEATIHLPHLDKDRTLVTAEKLKISFVMNGVRKFRKKKSINVEWSFDNNYYVKNGKKTYVYWTEKPYYSSSKNPEQHYEGKATYPALAGNIIKLKIDATYSSEFEELSDREINAMVKASKFSVKIPYTYQKKKTYLN